MRRRTPNDILYIIMCTASLARPSTLAAQEADSLRADRATVGSVTRGRQLGEASVRAWRRADPLRGSAAGSTRWDLRRMRELPQILGNADPLRYTQTLPAVQTSSEYDAGLHVQGCSAGHNAVMAGDAVIYNPAHLLGIFSTFNAPHFPAMLLDTQTGAEAPARLGGWLRMELPALAACAPDSAALAGEAATRTSLHGELSAGPMSSQATARLSVSPRLLVTASARQTYLNLLYDRWLRFDDSRLRYGFGDYNLTLSAHPAPRHSLTADFYYGQDNARLDDEASLSGCRMTWRNYAASLRWEYLGRRAALTQSVSLSGYESRFSLQQEATRIDIPASIRTFSHTLTGKSRNGLWCYGTRYDFHDVQPQSPSAESTYALPLVPQPKERAHEAAAWGEWTQTFAGGHWRAKAGLRGTLYAPPSGKAFCHLSPALSLSWLPAPSHSLTLRAAIKRQYLHQAGFSSLGLPTEFWFPASSAWQPQRAETLSLLYDGSFLGGAVRVSFEGYLRRLHNQTEYGDNVLDLLTGAYSLDNALLRGRGLNYGVGIQISGEAGPFCGWASYSWGRSWRRFEGISLSGRYPSSYERIHEANAVASLRVGRGLTLSATAVVASGTPYTAPKGFYILSRYVMAQYGEHNAERLPLYCRLDASATWTFARRKGREQGINVSLYNVTGRDNVSLYRLRYSKGVVRFAPVSYVGSPLPSFSYFLKF